MKSTKAWTASRGTAFYNEALHPPCANQPGFLLIDLFHSGNFVKQILHILSGILREYLSPTSRRARRGRAGAAKFDEDGVWR